MQYLLNKSYPKVKNGDIAHFFETDFLIYDFLISPKDGQNPTQVSKYRYKNFHSYLSSTRF